MTDNHIKPSIVVVEYDEVCYFLIQECLSSFAVEIIRCNKGLEIIELVKSNDSIALVFLDIYLKDKVSGCDLIKSLKIIKPSLPVVFQTAYVLTEIKNLCIEAGCDDFLPKPYKPDEIKNIVKKYVKCYELE
jgi:CheY-like chemotaxis protein